MKKKSGKGKITSDKEEFSVLKYITRVDSKPFDKAGIYFCCHHKDLKKYLDVIASDILEKENCCIWYKESGDILADEAFSEELARMDMFAVPVTKNLIKTEDGAAKAEIDFAIQRKIPVLPIIVENVSVKLFNEKFGDIQCLDRNESDSTALSYSKKLGDFLEKVIVSEKLRNEIRENFEGNIFLSYRKVDRAYATKLMRLIHKEEALRY
ncbi:MAG: hypothetical protein Q4G23_10195, partial [Clostridia bacterium]|nr:hypothetical protein [Clostridia bacterium]